MSYNFEIHIFGICLCYIPTGSQYWEIIFPCDDEHPARACLDGIAQDLRINERVMFIQFPADAIDPASATLDLGPPPLFNLSASYAHGSAGTPGVSNLKLKDLTTVLDPLSLRPRSFVRLRVPHATLYPNRSTYCPYYVQDVTGAPGLPIQVIGNVAREAILRFTVVKDISLTAVDVKDSSYTVPVGNLFPLPASGNVRSIEIDNDCHEDNCSKSNDFLNLYRIVKDDAGTQYAAGQIKCEGGPDKPIEHAPCGGGFEMTAGAYGNCDPVVSDPPPN